MNPWRLLLGIALVFWGIAVIINPESYASAYRWIFDFRGYEQSFGGSLVAIGLLFIWMTLRRAAR
jgi:hypothetical protein